MDFARIEFDETIGPKIESMDAQQFYDYVKSLRNEDFKKTYRPKKPYRVVAISRNKKGTFIIRVKRNPKVILKSEIFDAAKELKESPIKLWNAVEKRKIPIADTLDGYEDIEKKIKELPF